MTKRKNKREKEERERRDLSPLSVIVRKTLTPQK
jgi:hypothetical protein